MYDSQIHVQFICKISKLVFSHLDIRVYCFCEVLKQLKVVVTGKMSTYKVWSINLATERPVHYIVSYFTVLENVGPSHRHSYDESLKNWI